MIGVEAGIDSNGRKNRGGHAMENVVEFFIQDLCKKKNVDYLKEATPDKIKEKWGYDVPVDKASRRYDFVVNNGKNLFIVETNFYGGNGSKIKSTAGEYKELYGFIGGKYDFIWISDGEGLRKTQKSLREAFEQNKYLFNLDMVQKGVLEFLISR
jgi:type II restriction enzyme